MTLCLYQKTIDLDKFNEIDFYVRNHIRENNIVDCYFNSSYNEFSGFFKILQKYKYIIDESDFKLNKVKESIDEYLK